MTDRLTTFVSAYGGIEPPQDVSKSNNDPQLLSIRNTLESIIDSHPDISIYDIGAGNGVVFKLLCENENFKKNNGLYVAIDFDEKLSECQKLARSLKLNRKLEPIEIADFYNDWPIFSDKKIVFIRNVFHELNIEQTSKLLLHIGNNFNEGDTLIIQDLLTFPASERHNVCWHSHYFSECMNSLGFSNGKIENYKSKSGNMWFNYICTKMEPNQQTSDILQVQSKVINSRTKQWTDLSELGALFKKDNRDSRIVGLDFDLQFAALTRQLNSTGAGGFILNSEQNSTLVRKGYAAIIEKRVKSQDPLEITLDTNETFRSRGPLLNEIESFLVSDHNYIVVCGAVGVGKTALVRHAFKHRHYERYPIVIDIPENCDFWKFLEIFLNAWNVRIPGDLLANSRDLNASQVLPSIKSFINKFIPQSLVAFDNFRNLYSENLEFKDDRIELLMRDILKVNNSKIVFITGTKSLIPQPIKEQASPGLYKEIRVRNFRESSPIIGIIDDYFDRPKYKIDKYPAKLLDAIGGHPSLAVIAGKVLEKELGRALYDEKFFKQLENQMRKELLERLIDKDCIVAVQAFSNLRVPVPKHCMVHLSSEEATDRSIEDGILFEVFDNRWTKLIDGAGALRLKKISYTGLSDSSEDEDEDNSGFNHELAAELYANLYRRDDDPKWIRESYYHRILAGDKDFSGALGEYYYTEIVASADYCYKKRHYEDALELYKAADTLKGLTGTAEMQYASCLVRSSSAEIGHKRYEKLVRLDPSDKKVKFSHVDAILGRHEYDKAIEQIKSYSLDPHNDPWCAGQLGRAYRGLGDYSKAAEHFELHIAGSHKPNNFVYSWLALAQLYSGQYQASKETLLKAQKLFDTDLVLKAQLAYIHEKEENFSQVIEELETIAIANPDDVFCILVLGRTLLKTDNIEKGFDYVNECIHQNRKIKGADRSFMKDIRTLHLKLQGKYDDAIKYLNAATNKDPYNLLELLETIAMHAVSTSSVEEKIKILQSAKDIEIPHKFKLIAEINIMTAKIAAMSNDEPWFDETIEKLRSINCDQDKLDMVINIWAQKDGYKFLQT